MLRIKEKLKMVYIRRIKTLNLPFQFHTVQHTTKDIALLDSGVTENFLDEAVWKTLKIGCFQLSQPLTVNNVDSTKNRQRKIKYYCWIKVKY